MTSLPRRAAALLEPPADLDPAALTVAARDLWPDPVPESGATARFVPAGEDSWNFAVGSLWLSLRRDQAGHDPRSYEAAIELRHEAGLGWIVAPILSRAGRAVEWFGGRPIVAFPRLRLKAAEATSRWQGRACAQITLLHRAATSRPLAEERFSLPYAPALVRAVEGSSAGAAPSGPYSLALVKLIGRYGDAVKRLLEEARALAQECAAAGTGFVLTHGDVSPSNFPRCNGDLVGLDWGGLAWAPPERDWAGFRRNAGLRYRGRPLFDRFYDVDWRLRELTEYFIYFSDSHADDKDSAAKWQRMLRWLP